MPVADPTKFAEKLESELSGSANLHKRNEKQTEAVVRKLYAARRQFGITRLGSATRLDRAGVVVAQVVRPLSLSNVVAQGKGADMMEAAASALMESLECWAAERIAPSRVRKASARELGEEIRTLYSASRVHAFDAGWDQLILGWIDGFDLLSGNTTPIPLALVDTVYTLPSPHPVAFPRTTTGLAAAPTQIGAIIHAGLEVLERASVAAARRYPRSFREIRIDPAQISGPKSSAMLNRLHTAELATGIWLVPGEHDLPVFRCQVIETENHREIAPLPGEGFACDFSADNALARALSEAAQARVTALAGVREDITRSAYPQRYDRDLLQACRNDFMSPHNAIALIDDHDEPTSDTEALTMLLKALKQAGAQAVVVASLCSIRDPNIEVVRVVAPTLRDLFEE